MKTQISNPLIMTFFRNSINQLLKREDLTITQVASDEGKLKTLTLTDVRGVCKSLGNLDDEMK